MHAPLPKLPAKMPQERSRSRRERRSEAARKPVLHVVMPGMEVAREEIKPRETIAAFLRRTGWATKDKVYGWQFKKGLPTVLEVNGESVLRKNWRSTRIAANDNVRFVSYPLGGGNSSTGKQVIGLVALVAVAAFAIWAGPLVATALGFSGSALVGGLATAALGLGGSLLVNALVNPNAGATNNPNATTDQIYSVAAQGNTAKLGQPLPVWYGRLKSYPDFAATPWGEYVGNDQYLNVLLSVGMGSFSYENIYIDNTILWDQATGVQSQFTNAQVAFYEPGATVTLFPTNVDSSVEVTGQQLPDGSGYSTPAFGASPVPGTPLGPFVANPPATLAQSIAVDFVLPAGCFGIDPSDTQQQARPAAIRLIAEYAPVDNAGALTGSFTTLFDVTKVYASKSPIRDSVKVDVTPGRYTVQFKRGDAALPSNLGSSLCIWAGLRSFLKGNNSFPDVSTVAIRLLATQSTQGSYKFGVLATRKLPVWNGSAFVTQATRNNGWAFLDAVSNSQYGSGLPISKVDFNAIVSFAAGCTSRGDTFDYNFSAAVSVPAAFDKILTAARAKHFWLGDTVSVVRDEWRDVPSMLLTDREIVRDSTQINWTMLGDEDPDAVIIEYIDQNTWLPAQVQYPPNDGFFTATHAEVKRIDGIVSRDQAFRECAFYYLQSIYRRETVQIGTEYEGRAITFGSVLRVQSELPMAYGYGGAVVGVSGNALTLDPAPVWDAGPFYVRLRKPNGTYFGPVTATQGANASVANLDATSLAAVQTAQSTTLAAVLAREDGGEYPSFELGTGVSQSKLCVVLNGVPNGNLCTLNLVVDDIRVHATDLGTPPILPVGQFPTNASLPLIVGLNAMFGQGTAEPLLSGSWFPSAGAIYYVADVSYDDGNHWQQVYEGQDNQFTAVVTLAALRLRVQAVTPSLHGPYSALDLSAPTIVIASQTVALNSLIEGIRYQVTTALDQLNDVKNEAAQIIASLASNDIARNWLDKKETKSELSSTSGAISARITSVDKTASDATGAVASRTLTLETTVNDPASGVVATSTVSQGLYSQVNTPGTGIAAVITGLNTAVTDPHSGLSATATLSQSLFTQVNTPTTGIAAVVTDTATTVGGHTGSITSLQSSRDGVAVQFGVTGTIDGVTGGFVFNGVKRLDGSVSYGMFIRADVIVDGTITSAKIGAGQIQAINISAGSINTTSLAINSVDINTIIAGAATKRYTLPYSAGSMPPPMTYSILSGTATATISGTFSTTASGSITLYCDGVLRMVWGFGGTLCTSLVWDVTGLSSGNHTFEFRFNTGGGQWLVGAGMMAIQDLRR